MKILFRTSGGRIQKKELGLGHIYRCINLSKELSSDDLEKLNLSNDYLDENSLINQD